MAAWHIDTLNDLFVALFRPGEADEPVIRGRQRLVREDYFQLLFPDELCEAYLGKSKSNLTWFFNDDPRNKAIKRALLIRMRENLWRVVSSVHRKCQELLWPQGQHPAFDRKRLWEALNSIRVRGALNAKLRIVERDGAEGSRLRDFFEADPSAALARVVLMLAVASDAPEELIDRLWRADARDASGEAPRAEETPEAQIRRGRLTYLEGSHARAFEIFEKVARRLGGPATNAEESRLYCQMGVMLATGDGHYLDMEAARSYLARARLDENPESHYLYARYAAGEEARAALERAAELNCATALRELGDAWYGGSARLGCGRDVERARRFFQRGLAARGADGAHCAYMLGRIYEDRGETDSALSAYRTARDSGSAEAEERLAQLDWIAPDPEVAGEEGADAAEGPQGWCLMNDPTGDNCALYASLPGRWRVIACTQRDWNPGGSANIACTRDGRGDVARALSELAGECFDPAAEAFPELVIALLSQDAADNLRQAVEALRVLQRLAGTLGARRWELVERVHILMEAEHDYASLMLDAAFAGMPGLYFDLRLCDPALDAADQLLSEAPLFLPCVRDPEARGVRAVVLGTSEAAAAFVRRAVALPLPEEHPVSISVFGVGAEAMERRFRERCPGIESAPPTVRRATPVFRECALDSGGASELLRRLRERSDGADGDSDEQLFGRGNYYVIATGDDALNVRLGATLRAELLKLDPSFANLPFIAVHVREPSAAWLAGEISAGSGPSRHAWHSGYDLFCFGGASLYNWRRLRGDAVERRAKAIHLRYAGNPEDAQARREAMASYYRRQYNRDSSRAMALYMVYHLFAAGIALPDWRIYGNPTEEAALGPAYAEWLSDGAHLEGAVRLEHERWNCFMLSMGWESAMPLQVALYVQRGNPGHQLYLAKLHPFICDWQRLKSGELHREVEEAVHSRMPERRVMDPREADAEAVRYLPLILAETAD